MCYSREYLGAYEGTSCKGNTVTVFRGPSAVASRSMVFLVTFFLKSI